MFDKVILALTTVIDCGRIYGSENTIMPEESGRYQKAEKDMIEKELREIKRRFRPERSNIPKIVGCFVNNNGQIVSKISQSLGIGDSVVSEKLLGIMKKTLSGSLGVNLTELGFSTKTVSDGEEHKLLMELRKTALGDQGVLDRFYAKVTESVSFETNYVILLANDIYDVPTRHSDGEAGDSYEQFSYLICAVCPIKETPEALSFKEADSQFHSAAALSLLASPAVGFMFPTFDDRKTNIYSALLYRRNLAESFGDFTERVFARPAPMPPKAQKVAFSEVLAGGLGEECSFEVIRSVHAQVGEMVESHKESGDPEPLVITKSAVKTVLEYCGVAEEKIECVATAFDETFGANAALTPKNIVSFNKFDLSTPEVSIKVDPEHRDIVTTQTINGEKYIMIRVSGGVEVNGININLDD